MHATVLADAFCSGALILPLSLLTLTLSFKITDCYSGTLAAELIFNCASRKNFRLSSGNGVGDDGRAIYETNEKASSERRSGEPFFSPPGPAAAPGLVHFFFRSAV